MGLNTELEDSNLALRNILCIFTNLIGWSPIGKEVLIQIDDAYKEILSKRLTHGRVVALTEDGNALIEVDNSLNDRERDTIRLLAVPRHQGYNFEGLCWGGIAVNLFDPSEMNNSAGYSQGTWIAIASLKLSKRGR